MTPPDRELLEKFRTKGHEPSFTELVNRHLGLVHATALRITCQGQLAEEVSQTVFTKLARLGSPLKRGLSLVTWLHQTTRSTAIDLVRSEARRRKREETAALLATMSESPVPWEQISPVLDEIIGQLSPEERHLVLCRYFEGQSHAQVAHSLGLSEDAARMRVSRALEKVRALLGRRGITTTATALSMALPAQAMTAVPSGLAASVSSTALAATAASTTSIITIGIITMTKKTAIAAAAVLLAAGAGTAVYIASGTDAPTKSSGASTATSAASPTPATASEEGASSRFRGRERGSSAQVSTEETSLVSRYGEARVKMAKRITGKLVGFLGEDGLAGFMPLIEQQARQQNLAALAAKYQLSDEQKTKLGALLDKTSERKAAELEALLEHLNQNTLQMAEVLLAGDAFKRGELSEAEFQEIAGRLDQDKTDIDAMMSTITGVNLDELMKDPVFAADLKAVLTPSQLAVLAEEPSHAPDPDPTPADASADIGVNFSEPERLETLDDKVTSVASMFDGLKKVMEGIKAMEALGAGEAK